MQLRIFLLADFANLDAGNKLNIIGVFTAIGVQSVPAVHPSLHVVAKVAAELGEFETQRTFKLLFFSQDGTELGKVEGGFVFPRPQERGGDSEWNFVLGIQQLALPRAERYEFRLLVDEHLLGAVPLDVVLRPNPTQQ